MPAAGVARGRSPRPAPSWLHQLPAWIRRSTRDWSTNVFTSVDVLGPVGRAEPPQPLRDVSISMPMLELKPSRSEEHTSELQSRRDLVCRLLLEKKKKKTE